MNPLKSFDRAVMLRFPTLWKSRIHFMILISPFIITPFLIFLAQGADLTSLFQSISDARDMLTTIPLLFGIIIALYWLNVQNRFPIYMSFNFFSTLGLVLANLICLVMIFLPIVAFSMTNLDQMESRPHYHDDYQIMVLLAFHFIIIPFASLAIFINQFSFQEFIITLVIGIMGAILLFLLLITAIHNEAITTVMLSVVGGILTLYVFRKYLINAYTRRVKQLTIIILAFLPWITLEVSSVLYTGDHFFDSEPEQDILLNTSLATILVSVFFLWFFQRKIRRPEVVK